jgi:transcriptional regulator GlxA family with amidase domain
MGLAGLVGLVGGGMLLWGLYAWLQAIAGTAIAGACTGAVALAIAGLLAWGAQRTVR